MIELKAADLQAPPSIAALQNKALGIGLVGIAASIAGYLADPKAATESYLLAFIYWIAFPLGSLGLMMVHHLSGGGWGMPVRRIFEASARTLPFMALLGIPILLGMHHIYEWTDAAQGRRRSDPAAEAAVPEHPVLRRALRALLRHLDRARLHAVRLVAQPGHELRARLGAEVPAAQRARHPALRGRLDLRRRRLDDVARPALVLDHLRPAVPDPAGAGGDRLRPAADGVDVEDAADVAHRARQRHPRLRQVPAHLRHGLGLLLVLAVPDHLVGEPARGDSLVSRRACATAGSGSASC